MKSAWDILGVAPGSDDEAISGAYRRMAKALHPDVNKRVTATTEFKEVQRAYETLKDPILREKHDYALAKVETAGVEDDAVDAVLNNYGIDMPRKKKKKKKKKSAVQSATQPQPQPQFYQPPPAYVPPSHYGQNDRFGRGEFDGIPSGYEDHTLDGIL